MVKYLARLLSFFMGSVVVVFYLAFSPTINSDFYNNSVIFTPDKCAKLNRSWFGQEAQEVSFVTEEGHQLSGLFFGKVGARRTVLVHHGKSFNLNRHTGGIGFLLKPDTALLIYDYSGFGKSTGSPSVGGLVSDSRAAYRYLTQDLHIDPKTIVHYGCSLGTGPAIQIASEQPCAGLVVVAAYTSLKDKGRETFPFLRMYPDCLLGRSDFDSLRNIEKVAVPVLIVHGTKDLCFPIHHADRLFRATHEPKQFMRLEGAGHSQFIKQEQVDHVVHFVQTLNFEDSDGQMRVVWNQ